MRALHGDISLNQAVLIGIGDKIDNVSNFLKKWTKILNKFYYKQLWEKIIRNIDPSLPQFKEFLSFILDRITFNLPVTLIYSFSLHNNVNSIFLEFFF